jgi:hypothetical protein
MHCACDVESKAVASISRSLNSQEQSKGRSSSFGTDSSCNFKRLVDRVFGNPILYLNTRFPEWVGTIKLARFDDRR